MTFPNNCDLISSRHDGMGWERSNEGIISTPNLCKYERSKTCVVDVVDGYELIGECLWYILQFLTIV